MKNMEIISKTGDPRLAEVYVAQVRGDEKSLIEFVDACDPRHPKSEKWVIIVSTQIGCPIGCLMCDSGAYFLGNLTKEEIFAQIDYVINNPPNPPLLKGGKGGFYNHPKLKIQFARMGEPALNPAVMDVLQEMPARYSVRGLIPCIATTAPSVSQKWFDRLIGIKDRFYAGGFFQLQFSINSTDERERNRMMPIKKWDMAEIARYGERFYKKSDRKVILNFALAKGVPFEPAVLEKHFDPGKFIVKITPVNPTNNAEENYIHTIISAETACGVEVTTQELEKMGFETIISIGNPEEIKIGSNCGQRARWQVDRFTERLQVL